LRATTLPPSNRFQWTKDWIYRRRRDRCPCALITASKSLRLEWAYIEIFFWINIRLYTDCLLHPWQTVSFDFRFVIQRSWNQATSATVNYLLYTFDRIKQDRDRHGGGDVGTAEREFLSNNPRCVL